MAFMMPISRRRSRMAITSVFTIPMEATASARLPKIPRNTSSTVKNCCRLRVASRIEKVLKPIFLIASSTVLYLARIFHSHTHRGIDRLIAGGPRNFAQVCGLHNVQTLGQS